jgi:hypothetical protein
MATTSNLSNTLEVHAADNCDADSICSNTGTGSDQQNNCIDSECTNAGDHSFQRNRCEHTNTELILDCSNEGNRSVQGNTCISANEATCKNLGDDSTQNNLCAYEGLGTCSNMGDGSTQTNNCTLVYCSNSGDNSKQTTSCIGKEDVFHQAGGSCDNQGSGSTQTVTCIDVGSQPPSGDCGNLGDQSTQSITCARMERGCSNAANPENPTAMSVNCADGGACRNLWLGEGSVTQSITCHKSVCANDAFSSGTTQITMCNNAGGFFPEGCGNTGRDTTVLANGAPCKSGAPRTTTICQPGRTITIP